MKTLSIIIIFLILQSCNLMSKRSEFVCDRFEILFDLEKEKNTDEKIDFLNSFIQKNERCVAALIKRGDLYYLKGDLSSSKNDYKKALSIKENIYTFYKLGGVYQDEKKYDSSLFWFNSGLSKKRVGEYIIDNHVPSRQLMLEEDKYDVASEEIVFQMGISYYLENVNTESNKCFQYCIDQKYKMGNCFLYMGANYYEIKKYDSACFCFQTSLSYGDERASDYVKRYCK